MARLSPKKRILHLSELAVARGGLLWGRRLRIALPRRGGALEVVGEERLHDIVAVTGGLRPAALLRDHPDGGLVIGGCPAGRLRGGGGGEQQESREYAHAGKSTNSVPRPRARTSPSTRKSRRSTSQRRRSPADRYGNRGTWVGPPLDPAVRKNRPRQSAGGGGTLSGTWPRRQRAGRDARLRYERVGCEHPRPTGLLGGRPDGRITRLRCSP